jgi:basic membrane lipoprotein Med (substrate-binding protein (PBP1-ABC) superfamily)
LRAERARAIVSAIAVILILLFPGCSRERVHKKVVVVEWKVPTRSQTGVDLVGYGIKQLAYELDVSVEREEGGNPAEILGALEDETCDLFVLDGRGNLQLPQLLEEGYAEAPMISIGISLLDASGKSLLREKLVQLRFQVEEGSYLAGVLAGKMTVERTHPSLNAFNAVGYIGCKEDPLEPAYRAGFQKGVKSVNPGCNIVVKAVTKLDDGALAKTCVEEILKAKGDIIFCSPGSFSREVVEMAESRSYLAINSDDPGYEGDSKGLLATVVLRDDVALFKVVKEFLREGLYSGMLSSGVEEGMIELSLNNQMDLYIPDPVEQSLRQPIPSDLLK